ncbi:MAG TPA: SHOCT domain-containing protein, partial [Candidatus Limnocylindrales bacterium]|nr:SHOCT domain-containing protein [Candidatus Limnocylindrales bacterium]
DEVVWSWAIPGVLFLLMALGPLVGLFWVMRRSGPARGAGGSGRPRGSQPPGGAPLVEILDGPGQPTRGRTAAGSLAENREELAAISADFGAAITAAMGETPLDPVTRDAGRYVPVMGAERGAAAAEGSGAAPEPGFTEGTQALLDRLERLADMRDRGLLGLDEYETAKATIMAELEGRS